jgi:nucleoside-diphosphate-sugar epimerase
VDEQKNCVVKIGLTGASGWVGTHLHHFLENKGCEVKILDFWTRSTENKLVWNSEESLDWVLHLGASTSILSSIQDPFKTYKNNIDSTIAALEISHFANASFVYMSSYVYGKPQYTPINELHPVKSENPYMSSKLLCEKICEDVGRLLHIPIIVLRAFNIYGPGNKTGRLISDLVQQGMWKKDLVLNDQYPRRDYLYVKDFCNLIWEIVTKPSTLVGTYNVGSGTSYTNIEVAKIILKLTNPQGKIVKKNIPRTDDVCDCTMVPDKVSQTFGWLPKYSLELGLEDMIQNLKNTIL